MERPGRRGVLRISCDGDDRRFFFGLKFSIPEFFRIFFYGLNYVGISLGIQNNLKIRSYRSARVTQPRTSTKLVFLSGDF